MRSNESKATERPKARVTGICIATVPVLALTAGIPLANRLEPMVLGFPFFVAYQTFWVLMTPAFLYLADKMRSRK